MNNTDAFEQKQKEERAEIIHKWSGEKLLQGYEWYHDNFDPLNDARCETFNIIKKEIRNRVLAAS